MGKNLDFIIILLISCIYGCTVVKESDPNLNDDNCTSALDLGITINDEIVAQNESEVVYWTGSYDDEQIRISFKQSVSSDGESETFNFIFKKTENCLEIDRAYKYYDGANVDVSAITAMEVKQVFIQEWRIDEFFAGEIVYTDPHNKLTFNKKVWVNLDEASISDDTFTFFETCFTNEFPIEIDINNDGNTDFSLGIIRTDDIGNSPKFTQYTIQLLSSNLEENQILSPLKNKAPYLILFEPPFSSENTRQYFNGVKSALDIFYEFDAPYEHYNYFLSNQLTYYEKLNNTVDDYFLVKKVINNQDYYGWIKFKMNVENCYIEVQETFLSDTPNEHVYITE